MGFGPCSQPALSADMRRRYQALIAAGEASPQGVLAMFCALMIRTA